MLEMKKNPPILLRMLGLAHIGIAIVHLPNILFFTLLSAPIFLPLLLWLVFLGGWLWRPDKKLQTALRRTHYVLAPYAVFLIAFGINALHGAQLSAGKGGGLMGAFGLIPLAMGTLSGALSLATFGILHSTAFKTSIESQPDPSEENALK